MVRENLKEDGELGGKFLSEGITEREVIDWSPESGSEEEKSKGSE